MRIAIVGCGFVGGTVADFLDKHGATDGIEVVRVDPKIEGSIELYKDLTYLDGAILCLNAPTLGNGEVDSSVTEEYIYDLIQRFGNDIPIMVKSTIPWFHEIYIKKKPEGKYIVPSNVIYNPEFLRADHAKEDFDNQEFFIIGVDPYSVTHDVPAEENPHAKFWTNIFAPSLPNTEFIYTDRETAIMVKYTHNAWLATKVAFFHGLSQCMPGLSNYDEMTDILAKFTNIGPSHMKVPNAEGGLGFSGYCFPKDLTAFAKFTDLELAHKVNDFNGDLHKKKEKSSWTKLKDDIPDEDYIICVGTSHTLGECNREKSPSYTVFVEEILGIKVLQFGLSGASNRELLQLIVELNALGYLNDRCKLLIVEPRLTENTVRISNDVFASEKEIVDNITKHHEKNLQLNKCFVEDNPHGGIRFPQPMKDIISIQVGPQTLTGGPKALNKKFMETFQGVTDRDFSKEANEVIDHASYQLLQTQNLLRWYNDLHLIEAMQQLVKNSGIPFRWFLVDNRIKELRHVRFSEGKVTDIFKDMLLTTPIQSLMAGGGNKTLQDVDPNLLCDCGHFNEEGNKIIAEKYLAPAIKRTLSKVSRSKNDICG